MYLTVATWLFLCLGTTRTFSSPYSLKFLNSIFFSFTNCLNLVGISSWDSAYICIKEKKPRANNWDSRICIHAHIKWPCLTTIQVLYLPPSKYERINSTLVLLNRELDGLASCAWRNSENFCFAPFIIIAGTDLPCHIQHQYMPKFSRHCYI